MEDFPTESLEIFGDIFKSTEGIAKKIPERILEGIFKRISEEVLFRGPGRNSWRNYQNIPEGFF